MRATFPWVLLAAVACQGPPAAVKAMTEKTPTARPAPGQPAPAFSAAASNGKTISLADFKNKQTVVLAFFPKAFTGG